MRYTRCSTKSMLTIILLFLGKGLLAQSAPELQSVLQKLKSIRTYSYETEAKAVFPDGKRDRKLTRVYLDAANRQLQYVDDYQVVLLNKDWMFKADHRSKQASIFNVRSYDKKNQGLLPSLGSVFEQHTMARFLDSVVLKEGKLAPVKKKGDLTTYRITFPESTYLQWIEIVFNEKKQLPELIKTMSRFTEGRGNNGQVLVTTLETISRNYTTIIDPKVFDEQQFFRKNGDKIALNQFKTYKVSTIL